MAEGKSWKNGYTLPDQLHTTRPVTHYQTSYTLPDQLHTIRPVTHYQTSYTLPDQLHTTRPVTHYQTSSHFAVVCGKSAVTTNTASRCKNIGIWLVKADIFEGFLFAPAETTN